MDDANFIIVTDKRTIESVVENAVKNAAKEKESDNTDFEKDRLSKVQAAKLAGISLPTLDKMVKSKRFKQYNLGHRKYFLKSEIIESLRNQTL
jgi:hypothetical protein